MHSLDELFVPILFRLINRPPDRVNVNFRALALQLRYLAITESLAERREPFEKVGDLAHGEDLMADAAVATPGVAHVSCPPQDGLAAASL